MNINSHTEFLGLLGTPIKHSLSPRIHNAIFQHDAINAVYLCFDIPESALAKAVEGLRHLNARGFNVTIPYKEKVLPLLDELSEEVKLIQAANTVKNVRGRLVGYNTDGAGFIDSLKIKARFDPAAKEACVLGAGGAARSVAFYLCKERITSLVLFDIIKDKAEILAGQLKTVFKEVSIRAVSSSAEIPSSTTLLVNATGVGAKDTDPALLTSEQFKRFKTLLVYDLIYNQQFPPLLKEAQRQGCAVMNGIWMLIYQALRALTVWFDNDAFLQKADFCYNLMREQK